MYYIGLYRGLEKSPYGNDNEELNYQQRVNTSSWEEYNQQGFAGDFQDDHRGQQENDVEQNYECEEDDQFYDSYGFEDLDQMNFECRLQEEYENVLKDDDISETSLHDEVRDDLDVLGVGGQFLDQNPLVPLPTVNDPFVIWLQTENTVWDGATEMHPTVVHWMYLQKLWEILQYSLNRTMQYW